LNWLFHFPGLRLAPGEVAARVQDRENPDAARLAAVDDAIAVEEDLSDSFLRRLRNFPPHLRECLQPLGSGNDPADELPGILRGVSGDKVSDRSQV